MTIAQIEENLKGLVTSVDRDRFIYGLLLAYGFPKATITRLESGDRNMSKVAGEVLLQKKVLYYASETEDLHLLISQLGEEPRVNRHDPRFIIVTDFKILLAVDRKSKKTLDIALSELPKHADFLRPWIGAENSKQTRESEADRKAAEKMARLFDELNAENPHTTDAERHSLNVFLSRLLFCFFAEDTEIFSDKLFTDTLKKVTKYDGSDMHTVLDRLFLVLNTERKKRGADLPGYLNVFDHVNGGLFKDPHHAPHFTGKSRMLALECGDYNWKDINPDIFGSMMQAVVSHDERSGLGMHYTSVPNIMKVIGPLFLDGLHEEFNDAQHEPRRLQKLLERLGHIRVFDPACGSGNFLIIAYKELRQLEIDILKQLVELRKAVQGFDSPQLELIPKAQQNLAAGFQVELFSRVQLTQFYGIELKDFACEVAMLSLWLAEHQMNMQFRKLFGTANPTLPLREGGHIVQGNATRVDWETVCPKEEGKETYLLGNPPYLGARLQNAEHKKDMSIVFKGIKGFNNLDYIGCWFQKGAKYIQGTKAELAFVTTNSICQGEQVPLLWPYLFKDGLAISFAHPFFKWTNNAKHNAGVTVSIIGVRNEDGRGKLLYSEGAKREVSSITPYLTEGNPIIVVKRTKQLSKNLPEMCFGSMPNDGGNLILNADERLSLITQHPNSEFLIRKLLGAKEFLKGVERYCLWITDVNLDNAIEIPEIARRIQLVKNSRASSDRVSTQSLAKFPHRFGECRYQETEAILIPNHSSENRIYIPFAFVDRETVITNSAQAIYNAQPWVFGVISSKMHMVWVRAVCGGLETRIRYSSSIGYNTFPCPVLSTSQKEELEHHVYSIIEERQAHSEKTPAQLYDPDKMPAGLRKAHQGLDEAVERCYRSRPFGSDEERLAHLFKLYEEMLAEEKAKGTLFAKEKKTTKPRKKKA